LRIPMARRSPWPRRSPMPSAFTTRTATSGNGSRTPIMTPTTERRRTVPCGVKVLMQVAVWFVVVPGTAIRGSSVRPSATGSPLAIGTTIWASVSRGRLPPDSFPTRPFYSSAPRRFFEELCPPLVRGAFSNRKCLILLRYPLVQPLLVMFGASIPDSPDCFVSVRPSARYSADVSRVAFIPPALPKLRASPPMGEGWLCELKFDGYRVQLHKAGLSTAIYGRNGGDFTRRFPAVTAAVLGLP